MTRRFSTLAKNEVLIHNDGAQRFSVMAQETDEEVTYTFGPAC